MVKHTKKLLVQSLKIAFSAAIIFWLIQSGKLNFSALKNLLTPWAAVTALSLVALNIFFASERWRILIRSQGLPARSWPVFKLTLIGAFFNFAMPGGVGGDVIKAYYFTRENPGSKVVAVTSVLMDRVLGLFAMILLALLVMFYDLNHIVQTPALLTLFYFICGLFVAFLIALSMIFSVKLYDSGAVKKGIAVLPLSEKFLKLYESMHLYGKDGKRFIAVILMSLVSQACSIAFLYLAGRMAGFDEVSARTYFLVAPLGFMATAIPISPAGVGVGQAAFYFLFNLYVGKQIELGPTVITAFQVGTFVISLSGAFFYLRRKDRVETKEIEQET
ncbi:TIGR00374 family protein [Bdellovibrio bacteriovorus]|uniref:TIGR00374 family protein n=1 Tax=Bdellovibrio bacteriovorus TaxID=959 RepID=A0A161PS96_BDEBC|nr:lysylphosphatidylglycerol synthase transmembrane domain-containing protein [Bdellovibrio bacteriovorus]KYG68128.1 TIGR00374 family protein [Bdellovibrio bacteriovorus]